ncbi:disintegrin and metalloproteinase domain-containing protein 9-like [Ambystoma mexicanum]|uniref:disintegrin and metalloproteinase domain-containing protein 9-like n=1 Tax=Ambystoma mexicanum TaxID=8296 RepID=UPI0037E8FD1E
MNSRGRGSVPPSRLALLLLTIGLLPYREFDCLLTTSEITVPHMLLGIPGKHTDSILYEIVISANKYLIYLKKQIFLPIDFTLYINGQIDTSVSNKTLAKRDCYYRGYALDIPNSTVTIRTCSGLKGLLQFGNEIYAIEPLPLLDGFKHLVSKLNIGREVSKLYFQNDTDPESIQSTQNRLSDLNHFKQGIPFAAHTPRYLKLAFFVAHDLFTHLDRNVSSVLESVMKVMAILNTKFDQLNVHVFLVLLDIWAASNPIDINSGTPPAVRMAQFNNYTYQAPFKHRNYDAAVLLTNEKSLYNAMTYFGEICSQKHGSIVVYQGGDFEAYAVHIAHVLGHSIGLKHDNNRNCQCLGDICIMNQNTQDGSVALTFSSCSVADFETFISSFGATCLLIAPETKAEFVPSLCGNKWLDEGEDCDCGTPLECKDSPCCESNCTFKGTANCASGECCRNCQILSRGIECRIQADECDFPEYCDGIMPICTHDFFQQDGNFCNDETSYCFNGKCQNLELQCKQLFGPDSKVADASCFLEASSLHDMLEYCGASVGDSFKCDIPDAGCGKVQCTYPSYVPTLSLMASIQYYGPKDSRCASLEFMLPGKGEVADRPFAPLLVPAGTKCGLDHLCLGQKCQPIAILDLKCNKETDCNSNGLCNNKGNCHCDFGWQPPTCTDKGHGGSIDSGSKLSLSKLEDSDDTLIMWLLVVFCCFLPLFFICLVLVIKWEEIRNFCRRHSGIDESLSEMTLNAALKKKYSS